MTDYLEIEPMIVTRLKEKISNAQVLSSWGQPVIKENHNLPPSIMVFLEEECAK